MSEAARVERAGLHLPFRWWDGFVVLALNLVGLLIAFLMEWGDMWGVCCRR